MRNVIEMSRLMRNDTIMEKISMTGARIAMRMSIWNAFCTFVVSVVRRVMMDAVENLSMFENANVCTLLYISSRRFARKADGCARGNARCEYTGRQLERRQQQQKCAELPDCRHTAALDAEVDEVGHKQRDHDLKHGLQRREQNRHERGAFVFPQTAGSMYEA